jgi:hypothetical protein
MPLTRWQYLGFERRRSVSRFTMKDGEDTVRFAINSAAIDDLAAREGVRIELNVDYDALFKRYRDLIEVGAERKFFIAPAEHRGETELVLTKEDFQ